ncbi:Hypothetical predicted protein, partial [Mytilus galloprovincialis]
MGTQLHRVIDVNKGETNTTIISEHPGSMYKLALVERTRNGLEHVIGLSFLRTSKLENTLFHDSDSVVPALRPPQNISILSSNNAFHISWDLLSTDFSDFKVVVSYFVYPFNGTWTDMNLESNITGHMVDTSNNRGSKYGITLFLRSQYGESTHTDIIDARSDKPTNPPDDINVITRDSAIVLSWKRPNDRPEVIQHYIVNYQIGSNSADHMIKTNPSQTFVNIDTAERQGQIFALKIASETNGGVGHFSKANFIRA